MSTTTYQASQSEEVMVAFLEGNTVGKRIADLELLHSFEHEEALHQALNESIAEVPSRGEVTSLTGPAFRLGIEVGHTATLGTFDAHPVLVDYERYERGQYV